LINTTIKIAFFISIFLSFGFAQNRTDSLDSKQISTDNYSDSTFIPTKSPTGALIRSAIIPGWGQIYNGSWWKAPIIWGLYAYYASKWIESNKQYKKYEDLFVQNPDQNRFKYIRDSYRDYRDSFVVYAAIAYLLNLVDAYVDAHLFDFDVSENYFTKKPQLNIRMNLR